MFCYSYCLKLNGIFRNLVYYDIDDIHGKHLLYLVMIFHQYYYQKLTDTS